jgi:hypothetical protein
MRYQNYTKTKLWHWNYWVLSFKSISPGMEVVFGLLQILGRGVKDLISLCKRSASIKGIGGTGEAFCIVVNVKLR